MFSNSLRTTLRQARSYATASTPAIKATPADSAPYFLAAGIAGSVLFYASTLGSARANAEEKVAKAALSNEEFRNLK